MFLSRISSKILYLLTMGVDNLAVVGTLIPRIIIEVTIVVHRVDSMMVASIEVPGDRTRMATVGGGMMTCRIWSEITS